MSEAAGTAFDPNGPGIRGNLFGLPFTPETALVVIIPVPWEVTVSYRHGTSNAPAAILKASTQVDLVLKEIPENWKSGIAMLPLPETVVKENSRLMAMARQHIEKVESTLTFDSDDSLLKTINEGCEQLNTYLKTESKKWLAQNKLVGVVGGDHSTPLGFIRALSERYDRFGILQIDAHCDLRKSYEGFTYSHASIMFNALKIPAVGKLVQVGIRDYSDEELDVVKRAMGRVKVFFDQDIKEQLFTGKNWDQACEHIVAELPQLVYISFDIDGLDPSLCPNTGTPVPGGLQFEQMVHLLKKIVLSGKKIIGFDLCEVSPSANDWDANAGARMLYQLCSWMKESRSEKRKAESTKQKA